MYVVSRLRVNFHIYAVLHTWTTFSWPTLYIQPALCSTFFLPAFFSVLDVDTFYFNKPKTSFSDTLYNKTVTCDLSNGSLLAGMHRKVCGMESFHRVLTCGHMA